MECTAEAEGCSHGGWPEVLPVHWQKEGAGIRIVGAEGLGCTNFSKCWETLHYRHMYLIFTRVTQKEE